MWPPFAGITQVRLLAVGSTLAALSARGTELPREGLLLRMLRPKREGVKRHGTGPICFAILRSRSPAALNVYPRTPRAADSLGPRLARNLAQCWGILTIIVARPAPSEVCG